MSTETSINTVGKFNTIGGAKITTKGTTAGVQQTQESKNAAPPIVPEPYTFGEKLRSATMIAGIMFCAGGMFLGVVPMAGLGIVITLGSFAISTAPTADENLAHMEQTAHQRKMAARWEQTFECGACGNRFVPIGSAEQT